jgi:hypothetical protein
LPPVDGVVYRCFVDAAGGGPDAYTIAIGHREGDTCIIDVVRGTSGKFDPQSVTEEYAALCRQSVSALWSATIMRANGLPEHGASLVSSTSAARSPRARSISRACPCSRGVSRGCPIMSGSFASYACSSGARIEAGGIPSSIPAMAMTIIATLRVAVPPSHAGRARAAGGDCDAGCHWLASQYARRLYVCGQRLCRADDRRPDSAAARAG